MGSLSGEGQQMAFVELRAPPHLRVALTELHPVIAEPRPVIAELRQFARR
jgi:hypothetical protein